MHFKNGQLVFKKNFIVIPYNENTADYFAFLKGLNNNEYLPAVLTSKMMIDYIASVTKKHKTVYQIEFMEEDDELYAEIKELLYKVNNNSYTMDAFINVLRFHIENFSAEIKRVYIRGVEDTDNYFIQANGIIGIDEAHYEAITDEICVFMNKTQEIKGEKND